jgi:hypothetical protein
MRHEDVMGVMNDPLAQELMRSAIPARLAYVGPDGFPRVVPVGSLWNGAQLIVCTATNAPKVRALRANPKVALTIDTNTQPPHVLLIRGTASVEMVDGVPPEFFTAARRYIDPLQWPTFEAQTRAMYQRMARIAVVPEWAEVLDFETRIPSFLQAQAAKAERYDEATEVSGR